MDERRLLVIHVRPARRRARDVATVEALCLFRDLQPETAAGGPLAEEGGVIWITVPADALDAAIDRCSQLGYSCAVDIAEPTVNPNAPWARRYDVAARVARWHGRAWQLRRVYVEDTLALREQAPDRRVFLLETADGVVRPVKGYRGDGQALSRRGLPVCDARLLVNLVFAPARGMLLDPFAGAGGIVVEAVRGAWQVRSVDADPALRYGLARLGSAHTVGDARKLPFPAGSVDAIATEPPYNLQASEVVVPALREMHRVLKEGGRLALLGAAWQAAELRQEGARLGLICYLDAPIDRKGTDVVVLAWQK